MRLISATEVSADSSRGAGDSSCSQDRFNEGNFICADVFFIMSRQWACQHKPYGLERVRHPNTERKLSLTRADADSKALSPLLGILLVLLNVWGQRWIMSNPITRRKRLGGALTRNELSALFNNPIRSQALKQTRMEFYNKASIMTSSLKSFCF